MYSRKLQTTKIELYICLYRTLELFICIEASSIIGVVGPPYPYWSLVAFCAFTWLSLLVILVLLVLLVRA